MQPVHSNGAASDCPQQNPNQNGKINGCPLHPPLALPQNLQKNGEINGQCPQQQNSIKVASFLSCAQQGRVCSSQNLQKNNGDCPQQQNSIKVASFSSCEADDGNCPQQVDQSCERKRVCSSQLDADAAPSSEPEVDRFSQCASSEAYGTPEFSGRHKSNEGVERFNHFSSLQNTGAALPLVSKASQTHITRQVPGQRERVDTTSPAQHVWLTQEGLRVNFRGNKFTVPLDVELTESCDTSLANTLEFHVKGHSRENPLRLLQRLRSTYSNPSSPLFNEKLQFDVVDERLYVTMTGSISSDFVAELVLLQLRNYQSRMARRFPAQPCYILSGSSALVHIDGTPMRLCGDGCIVEQDELVSKTKEVHAIKRAVPRNLKVYVNFEALSYTDDKRALISKCEQQVLTGQAEVAVALCDRAEDGEVHVFSKGNAGELIVDTSVNPRYIDLSKVFPSFRVYLSYGVNIYFQAHHDYKLKRLQEQELTCLLCNSILQRDKEMAKELINGLPSINHVDDHGRLAMVCAAENGDKEMVDYLLDNGAEVNKMDARGVSPLLVAAENGDKEMVDCLLDNGAEVNKMDARGVSPLLAARAKGYDDIANLIESRGTSIDLSCFALVDAIHKVQLERLELLLRAGAMVDETDTQGRTPLMHACLFMHRDVGDVVRQLLRAGASSSLHDNFGNTARDLAEIIRNDIALSMLCM